jgi:hypothetical protein
VIDTDLSRFLSDAEVLRSRFKDRADLDPAVIGTHLNEGGVRVLVYDEASLIEIEADRLVRGDGAEPVTKEEAFNAAADTLFYRLGDHLRLEKGRHAPLIAHEAVEDAAQYEAEGFTLLLVNSVIYFVDEDTDPVPLSR